MNGAESLVRTAVSAGVEICFANPGTSEMPLVAALDSEPGVRAVLGLFEGVLSGAADGYGRMAEKPALTLFHLGPGFGNSIANSHNARRARTPIVHLIGDQATWHQSFDAPLTTDIESLAKPVSGWFRANQSAKALSGDVAAAIAAASLKPGRSAVLTVPTDCQWDTVENAAAPVPIGTPPRVDSARLETAARILSSDKPVMLLVGGHGLRRAGLSAAGRIAAATNCRLGQETFAARVERGPGLPSPERVPYFPEGAPAFFEGLHAVLLVGAPDPVAFFGYPSGISRLVPAGIDVVCVAEPEEDVVGALAELAEILGAPTVDQPHSAKVPGIPTGALDPQSIGLAIAAVQPEGAIIVEEGITSAGGYLPASSGCPDHTLLHLTGGAIGWGLPCATGAALACPDRKVITLEGDGSGLYTIQALWTQARENLNIVNVVFANNIYRILQIELHRAGIDSPGPQGQSLTDLGTPAIDWASLSRGFGVDHQRVENAEQLSKAIQRGLDIGGPCVVEVPVS